MQRLAFALALIFFGGCSGDPKPAAIEPAPDPAVSVPASADAARAPAAPAAPVRSADAAAPGGSDGAVDAVPAADVRAAEAPPHPSDYVFDEAKLRSWRLVVKPADWKKMQDQL